MTRDVDLTLLTGFGGERAFINALLGCYASRISDAATFALQHRVLLLRAPGGVGIDISLGALRYEERVVSLATEFAFEPGISLRTCSAEDLIILKLFALRALDVHDAEGVAIRNKDRLDWDYIAQELQALAEAKDDPGFLRSLDRIRGLTV